MTSMVWFPNSWFYLSSRKCIVAMFSCFKTKSEKKFTTRGLFISAMSHVKLIAETRFYSWRSISAKIQCSILHCALHNLSYILCLSFEFALAIQLFFAFNIQLWFMQHSSFPFRLSLFIRSSQVSEFDLQVQWDVHSLFRIQHLAFFL